MKTHNTGFTLIELMVTIAIVSILAVIAIPAYQEQVRKTRRADCQAELFKFANAMEKYFTINNTYNSATNSGLGFTQCTVKGTKMYDLTISAQSVSSYTLQAAPASGSPQANDKCGTLTVNNLGQKNISSAASGITNSDCW